MKVRVVVISEESGGAGSSRRSQGRHPAGGNCQCLDLGGGYIAVCSIIMSILVYIYSFISFKIRII